MPRNTRLHSFLDRFEERLQVDCERLKRQLVDQVEMRFGDLRLKLVELRNGFGRGDQVATSPDIDLLLRDDPSVKNISLDEWMNQQRAVVEEEKTRTEPSTSSGYKRKSSSQSQSGNFNKLQKTHSTDGSIQHSCKFTGCNKTFHCDVDLVRHKFSIFILASSHSLALDHFKLPRSVKKQI